MLLVNTSLGCTCIWEPLEFEDEIADVVFTGKVKKIKKIQYKDSNDYGVFVKLKLIEPLKGKTKKTIIIKTGFGNGDCGFHFEKGKKYFIVSYYSSMFNKREIESLQTDNCLSTGLISNREKEIDYFREIKKSR